MMPPIFPFFRFPMYYNSYRNPYYNNLHYNTVNSTVSSVSSSNHHNNYDDRISKNNGQKSSFSNNIESQRIALDYASPSSEQFFDIFGIHLYFDDILILCLLFFLYQEEVNDQFLFIALLLLLLS